MKKLLNAFSLQMFDMADLATPKTVSFVTRTKDQVKDLLGNDFQSAIGHADTAAVLSDVLGVDVPMNRVNVKIDVDDTIIVAQLMGGRLPEGSTTLPDGFDIVFIQVITGVPISI